MRLAVFASGGGTNFQAILDAVENGTLPITVALCLSNTPKAGALARAKRHGVATTVLDPRAFEDEALACEAVELGARVARIAVGAEVICTQRVE